MGGGRALGGEEPGGRGRVPEFSLTFQHLPPEALSRGQPWTPERELGGSASGCAPRTHRLGMYASIHPHCLLPLLVSPGHVWSVSRAEGFAPVALTTISVGGQRSSECLSGCTVLVKGHRWPLVRAPRMEEMPWEEEGPERELSQARALAVGVNSTEP